ncbi:glycosyltransferase [Kamptonema formosum]|uniref:glycosyltransferase n=1 Tax=Kamptonema formosum TaxID=331992 RepID=UPI0003474397|nr:glycosyltransferase [Oscillatoria sp. PCC 10802]
MELSKRSQSVQPEEEIVVAICTYNNAHLLERTLATIEQQQVNPSIRWSVLVVDNNSTDETPAVVQKYAGSGRISRLRSLHEPCQGLAYARRRAICETASELIAFVDDDCLLSPDWVQQAVMFFREHPKAGAAGSRVQLLWEVPPDSVVLQFQNSLACQDRGDLLLQMPSTGDTYLVGAGLVLRRSALLASGWLDKIALVGRKGKQLTSGEDVEIVLRIRNAGYELWYNPAMQLQHYIPQRRMSVDYLCRLQRGIGQTRPILSALANLRNPTLIVRLSFLRSSFSCLARIILSIAYKNVLRGRPVSPERKVYLYSYLGFFEGSVQFIFQYYAISRIKF